MVTIQHWLIWPVTSATHRATCTWKGAAHRAPLLLVAPDRSHLIHTTARRCFRLPVLTNTVTIETVLLSYSPFGFIKFSEKEFRVVREFPTICRYGFQGLLPRRLGEFDLFSLSQPFYRMVSGRIPVTSLLLEKYRCLGMIPRRSTRLPQLHVFDLCSSGG